MYNSPSRRGISCVEDAPGYRSRCKGNTNAQQQLVATDVIYWGNDLGRAEDIQAGLAPVEQEVARQQKKIAAEQNASAEHAAEIAVNQAAIAAATAPT